MSPLARGRARTRPASGRARRPRGWSRAARSAGRRLRRTPPAPAGRRAGARARPTAAAAGCALRRVDGVDEAARSKTMTPAVSVSRIVCSRVRAPSSWATPRSTCARASASCAVISANERVRPPSSSADANTGFGCRSPAATWRTPSASSSSGRASWLPSTIASSTEPNTARISASVSVPMYIRLRPSRASARCWYSLYAACTASALAGDHARHRCTTIRKRSSAGDRCRSLFGSRAIERTRVAPGSPLAIASSSSPSTWLATPSARAWRSSAGDGRSAGAALPPADVQHLAVGADQRDVAARRAARAGAPPTAARAGRARRPAARRRSASWRRCRRRSRRASLAERGPTSSAPATLTSNQASMLRETNWYDTV